MSDHGNTKLNFHEPYGEYVNNVSVGMKFKLPPKPNWEARIGSCSENAGIWFKCYFENPPNRFQRWLMSKCLGINWKSVDNT